MPFWPQYPTRNTSILNGMWDFGFETNISDIIHFNISHVTFTTKAPVPGCFDVVQPGIVGPKGTAFYRRHFMLPRDTTGLLYFAACSFYCQIFVDGLSVGDHRSGGYHPFWINIPASSQQQRELIVLVDNRFNKTTAPTHTGGDFYNYGGITRDVILHQVPSATYIERVETFTLSLEGSILIRVVLRGNSSVPSVAVGITFDEHHAYPSVVVPVKNGTVELNATVPNATIWSITTPNLHTARISLNQDSDVVTVRFGIRTISISNTSRLLLNDEEVKLRGFNRHTMWPDTGSALSLEQVKKDVKLLQDVGANYVRGSHYPQDQRFLDLCDEYGIVVWEETLGPGVKVKDLLDPYWMKYQVEAINQMISASINHPSVLFHAFYNEGPSNNPIACPGYNASAVAIRERVGNPPSRLVTWASDKRDKDVCLDIADVPFVVEYFMLWCRLIEPIPFPLTRNYHFEPSFLNLHFDKVSFNYYPAWYHEPGNMSYPKAFWNSMAVWVQEHFPEMPFFISETGAGGIYEWKNTSDPFWSQKYQAEVVKEDIEFALNSNRVSGITIWQFADIKANMQATAVSGPCDYAPHPKTLAVPWNCSYIDISPSRPGGENHKGAMDFWRRSKDVYFVAKELYTNYHG
eukprot:gene6618-325_t